MAVVQVSQVIKAVVVVVVVLFSRVQQVLLPVVITQLLLVRVELQATMRKPVLVG